MFTAMPRQPWFKGKTGRTSRTENAAPEERREGWDPVAAWYDKLVGDAGSDYHRNVILPGAMKLLAPKPGESVIDLCCGQGVLMPPLCDAGITSYLGVDASKSLIAAARKRAVKPACDVRFQVADACKPGDWADGSHDALACLMAVHDVPDFTGLARAASAALKPGGRSLWVMMHPCFRIPQKSHWGWDHDQKVQYRRVDAYAGPQEISVATHPGRGSDESTAFYHRPLAEILTGLGAAGLAVTGCEEWCSHRRSQGGGPFSRAEHRAAAEFPLFLALLAMKPGA